MRDHLDLQVSRGVLLASVASAGYAKYREVSKECRDSGLVPPPLSAASARLALAFLGLGGGGCALLFPAEQSVTYTDIAMLDSWNPQHASMQFSPHIWLN